MHVFKGVENSANKMSLVSARIGFRYSKSRGNNSFIALINFFSVLGLGLGVAALIVVLSVMNGLDDQLKQRILGVVPHIVIPHASLPQRISHPITDSLSAAQRETIVASMPFIERQALIQSSQGLSGVSVQGIDPKIMKMASTLDDHFVFNDLSGLQARQYHVVIGYALARKLNVQVGDTLRIILPSSSRFTPFGRVPAQRNVIVSGVFSLQSVEDSQTLFMHIEDLHRLARIKYQPDVLHSSDSTRWFINDPFSYGQISTALDQLGISHTSWREKQGPLFDAVKMEKNMMALMLLLVIAVAAFNIISALVMVVIEKTSDIAILRTQGLTAWQVMQIFMFNGLFNGIKGTGIGMLLGLALVFSLNPILIMLNVPIALSGDGTPVPILLRLEHVALIVGISLSLCVLATIPPALTALRLLPAQSLKYE